MSQDFFFEISKKLRKKFSFLNMKIFATKISKNIFFGKSLSHWKFFVFIKLLNWLKISSKFFVFRVSSFMNDYRIFPNFSFFEFLQKFFIKKIFASNFRHFLQKFFIKKFFSIKFLPFFPNFFFWIFTEILHKILLVLHKLLKVEYVQYYLTNRLFIFTFQKKVVNKCFLKSTLKKKKYI